MFICFALFIVCVCVRACVCVLYRLNGGTPSLLTWYGWKRFLSRREQEQFSWELNPWPMRWLIQSQSQWTRELLMVLTPETAAKWWKNAKRPPKHKMRLHRTVITSQTLWSLGLGGVFWFPLVQWNSEKVHHTVGRTWTHTYVCVDYRLHTLYGGFFLVGGGSAGTVIFPLLRVTRHGYNFKTLYKGFKTTTCFFFF